MKLLQTFSAAIMLVFASCCSSSKTMISKENISSTTLYETKWILKKIYTEEGIREVDTKAFIRFDKEKNSAGGNGSCNTFGSTTTIHGNEVSFKNVFSTKMYCEAVQNIEDVFFKQLEKVTRFEIADKKLHLLEGGKLLLQFITE
jgi:heat shock protein HslJ